MARSRAWTWIAILLVGAGAACSTAVPGRPAGPHVAATPVPRAAAESPAPSATPAYPPYYIESLRATSHPGGKLDVGAVLGRGSGFTKYRITWPSAGSTMTGSLSMPDGDGPFPVVVAGHGHITADRYWVGQDSWLFGDPLVPAGFIAVYPDYPGHAGSGPEPDGFPALVGDAVTVMDLVGSLTTLPKADTSRIAMIGHSNGGGVGLLMLVSDPRVKAYALFAPNSSDNRDPARKWWLRNGEGGPLGDPEQNPDGYRHISPRWYFEAGQAPVLIVHGTADGSVPGAWSDATYAALQAAGVKSRLVWIPGAQHDFVAGELAQANQEAKAWISSSLGTPG